MIMKTQIAAVSLAFSVSALAPTSSSCLAFTPSPLIPRIIISPPRVSSVQLHATSRSDNSDTALNAVMVDTADYDTNIDTELVLITADDDNSESDDKAYLKDGFVFGMEGSGLDRPKGKVASVVVEGDTLETQTYQVAIVAATLLAHAGFSGAGYLELLNNNGGDVAFTSVQAALLAASAWLLADLGSGVLHWSVDNYGNGKTPIMGSIIAAFQGHHSAPWTITEREFCNNVYKLCIPFGIVPMTLINFLAGPAVTIFFAFFCATEIMSQEFHKWSHMTKTQTPGWVNWLQDTGLTIGRIPHAMHHLAPYDGNYCIISGVWNKALDESGIFRWMEHMVYKTNGVEANAWKIDAELRERTLSGDYSLPESHKRRYQ